MELQKEISNNIDSVSDGHDGTVIGNGRLVIIRGGDVARPVAYGEWHAGEAPLRLTLPFRTQKYSSLGTYYALGTQYGRHAPNTETR